MKEVFYHELRTLLPHLREGFLARRRQYKGQTNRTVRFESDRDRDIKSGTLKHHGGYREGYASRAPRPIHPSLKTDE